LSRHSTINTILTTTACVAAFATVASAADFNIPGGDLEAALNAYSKQAGIRLMYSDEAVRGVHTKGVSGAVSPEAALTRLLSGTGFVMEHRSSGTVTVVRDQRAASEIPVEDVIRLAQANVPRAPVETVTVTSSKLGGADVQSIPIAITALSQEQLTSTQTAGGPDLVKQVPNLTFTKTNFTGYDIQIRGIGTQAISVTTDPAVAVAFNDTPFIRNHFFEQEFYDVSQVEVLRGPQGTLYGRNATAGVVNVISARPTDRYEAMGSVDVGNYNNRRLEGMLNVPVLDEKIDLRVAGEWTKRDGYAYNDISQHSTDGRDLYSARVSLLVHPIGQLTATAIWEHFQENDDRSRSTKQLCNRSNAPAVVNGPAGPQVPNFFSVDGGNSNFGTAWLSQGCSPESLYSPLSYQTPNGGAFPFIDVFGVFDPGYLSTAHIIDPYTSLNQPHDLREISSEIDPVYRAKNDTFEFNADYNVTPELTLTSQTAYSKDFLYSTEDFNRFATVPDFLQDQALDPNPGRSSFGTFVGQDNQYCDPQFGCSSRFIAVDRSSETARQFYQEVRLASNYQGRFNFLVGANYMNYHTTEDYYVFSNLLTLFTEQFNHQGFGQQRGVDAPHIPFDEAIANSCIPQISPPGPISGGTYGLGCAYIDPNPIDKANEQGHNYFLSHNPYAFNSWAGFGEVYYQVAPDVKLTGGLRYTDDKKNFPVYPSQALMLGKGIPQDGEVDQEWRKWTGRAVVNWTPKLDFTNQTMVYASFSHGYKGGGANPPGVVAVTFQGFSIASPSDLTHPLTFKPEYNNAFELGTKNTALDGVLVFNTDAFLYKYKNYQISQIVDRTAVNFNFNATVMGAEIESTWSPIPGLKLGFNGGYERATFDDNQYAIDLMDRTAGHPGWMTVKPFITQTSNCVLPTYVVNEMMRVGNGQPGSGAIGPITTGCLYGYGAHIDPVTQDLYTPNPNPSLLPGYPGYDPNVGGVDFFGNPDPENGQNIYNGVQYLPPNQGQGFTKNIGGNQLPNAPHFTTSLSADYTMPLSSDWAGTLHGDFYWQSGSYWRIFNDSEYDKLHGYTNINLALIFTNQDGWQSMLYVKNLVDTTAITGAFLNSDDTGLTTNVFTTDPRLFGIRITKNW